VRARKPEQQLLELFDRLDLARAARPFTRCLTCNGTLRAVERERVAALVPPAVAEWYPRFAVCDGCARVFWEGSHWRRMRDRVDALLAATNDTD
jgi:uncharacterized protein with PIN domain